MLEGLAASGLRSIRYALELDGVSRIDANDLDPSVVESMKQNIAFNGAEVEAKVQPTCSDARLLMLQNPGVGVCPKVGGLLHTQARYCWLVSIWHITSKNYYQAACCQGSGSLVRHLISCHHMYDL